MPNSLPPHIRPGYSDGEYWRSARTSCCGMWLVYWEPKIELWVHWAGWEPMPEGGVFCRMCGERVLPP